METELEQELHARSLAYLRRTSMRESEWRFTALGALRPELAEHIQLEEGERVLVSSLVPSGSWYVFTTRRFRSLHAGVLSEVPALRITLGDVGNFKGILPGQPAGTQATEVGTIVDASSKRAVRFEFETLYASMAPIYASKFWERRAKVARLTAEKSQRASTGT